ncbi:MAG: shikimate dehydrogenase [Bacteroidia bacterium]|nr:shikimate dehydrogenase [Bacteroidia bacterium]
MHNEYGIIGTKLGHSFSPEYFSTKFKKSGLKHTYTPFELESIDELPHLIRSRTKLVGLNVTIPFKEQVIPLLHHCSPEARDLGAVNTIKIVNNEFHGFNTDVIGFEISLNSLGLRRAEALVLGTGGASKAVQFVLKQKGVPFQLVSRSAQPGVITYRQLDRETMGQYNLIINTTPLGMYPEVKSKPELPYHCLTEHHTLMDLVYEPRLTRFLAEGFHRGCRIKNGFQMLVEQAEASWKIWQ